MAKDKGEQYSLKWNNHRATVMSAFNCLYENEKHADCTLAAEGKTIKAHKVMISACSPYFERLLEDHSKDKSSHPIVVFNDMTFFELKALCEYMYKGQVNVPMEHLNNFLKIAKNMQVRGLCDSGGGDSFTGMETKQASIKSTPAPVGGKRKQQAESKAQQESPVTQQASKRKRQDGFESDNSTEGVSFVSSPRGRGRQLKQVKAVAACPPRMAQEVKPEIKQEEPEPVYEETVSVYQDLTFEEEEIYQDPSNDAGTSVAPESAIEFNTWNDGNSNEFTVQDVGNQDQVFRKHIIKEFMEIKKVQQTMSRQLNEIVQMMETSKAAEEKNIIKKDLQTKLPISNIDEMENVETMIEDEETMTSLMNELAMIGGKSGNEMIRRILSTVLTNTFAAEFNWLGKGNKRGFSSYKLTEVIIKSVRQKFENMSLKEIEDAMRNWLRHAPVRATKEKLP